MKLFVIDKEKGPIKDVVAPPSHPAHASTQFARTRWTPRATPRCSCRGQSNDVTYLSLGGGDVATTVTVTSELK